MRLDVLDCEDGLLMKDQINHRSQTNSSNKSSSSKVAKIQYLAQNETARGMKMTILRIGLSGRANRYAYLVATAVTARHCWRFILVLELPYYHNTNPLYIYVNAVTLGLEKDDV